MFDSGVSPATQAVLAKVAELTFTQNYYLAGGTACALYYGHRLSYDLDFFSQNPESSSKITKALDKVGKLSLQQVEEGTWLGDLDNVKLSYFLYPYALIEKETSYKGIRIAPKVDIACMKLEAIGSRGIKRDFVDMYYLTQELGLGRIFEGCKKKFGEGKYPEMHFLRSLIFFDDAEESEDPRMLQVLEWERVKEYFVKEVKKLRLGRWI